VVIRWLQWLRTAGFRLVAISNTLDWEAMPPPSTVPAAPEPAADAVDVDEDVKALALDPLGCVRELFHDVIESHQTGIASPDPRCFALALGSTHKRPSDALYIDDFVRNVDAACRVGIHGLVCRRHAADPEGTSFIEDLCQVLGIDTCKMARL
jgi:phosphoglycolate phosphatase-like HAD superfamily hydrolase